MSFDIWEFIYILTWIALHESNYEYVALKDLHPSKSIMIEFLFITEMTEQATVAGTE